LNQPTKQYLIWTNHMFHIKCTDMFLAGAWESQLKCLSISWKTLPCLLRLDNIITVPTIRAEEVHINFWERGGAGVDRVKWPPLYTLLNCFLLSALCFQLELQIHDQKLFSKKHIICTYVFSDVCANHWAFWHISLS
jgi:hypothetical protein